MSWYDIAVALLHGAAIVAAGLAVSLVVGWAVGRRLRDRAGLDL